MGGQVKKTSLELQKNFTELQITADTSSVIENSTLEIECRLKGGYPTPHVTFILEDKGLFRIN